MIEDWDLASTNLRRLRERSYEVAVLPVGATEPHNLHLPCGQDVLHAEHVARRCCREAWAHCESVLCLPAIPFGVDCNLADFPVAVHVRQQTLDAMVADVIRSIRGYGLRKFVLLNGHGGNDFRPLMRQIQCDLDVFVFLCDWWTVGADVYDDIFDTPDDHAGEMETSVAMALHPDRVEPGEARNAPAAAFRFEALEKGWVSTSRNFARLNDVCGAGDPRAASAEKGNRYLDVVCARISRFLAELANSDIDEDFPHVRK